MTETTSYPHAVTLSAEMMSTLRHGEQAMQVAQDAAQRGFAATLAAVLSMHGVPVGADFVVEPQDDGTAIVRHGDAPTKPQLVTDDEGAE